MKILLSTNPVVNEYFYYTMEAIEDGVDKESLEDTLIDYEQNEEYLACAGIKKALDLYEVYNEWLDEIYEKQHNENKED